MFKVQGEQRHKRGTAAQKRLSVKRVAGCTDYLGKTSDARYTRSSLMLDTLERAGKRDNITIFDGVFSSSSSRTGRRVEKWHPQPLPQLKITLLPENLHKAHQSPTGLVNNFIAFKHLQGDTKLLGYLDGEHTALFLRHPTDPGQVLLCLR